MESESSEKVDSLFKTMMNTKESRLRWECVWNYWAPIGAFTDNAALEDESSPVFTKSGTGRLYLEFYHWCGCEWKLRMLPRLNVSFL